MNPWVYQTLVVWRVGLKKHDRSFYGLAQGKNARLQPAYLGVYTVVLAKACTLFGG